MTCKNTNVLLSVAGLMEVLGCVAYNLKLNCTQALLVLNKSHMLINFCETWGENIYFMGLFFVEIAHEYVHSVGGGEWYF